MATFPPYVRISAEGFGEAHGQVAMRSDMDRGVPKQRRVQSDVLVTLSLTLLFLTREQAANFEEWYYSSSGAAGGATWFDFTDPRTRTVRQCRVVANSLGTLTSMGGGMLGQTTRTLQIEYLRNL